MEIINGLDFQLQNSSVSLGKFDGVHRGHRFLLQEIQENKSYIFPRGSPDILNILPEKVHYSFNLVSRTLPVLGRKCIECHAFNSKLPRPVAAEH